MTEIRQVGTIFPFDINEDKGVREFDINGMKHVQTASNVERELAVLTGLQGSTIFQQLF